MEERDYHLLQKGKKLNNRYIIEDVLGEGGFGITYVGRDELLGVKVAVKEYYPQGVVTRNNSVDDVVTVTYAKQNDIFHKGKAKFLSEARVIARFNDQEGIVNVTDFFEENNTAYIVMEFLDGITMKDYVKQNGLIDAADILELMAPVLESLDEVHRQGLIHRDISPDNIMLLKNGKVKLMDFGAARDYTDFGQKSLSIVLKPGYAPEEQYRSKGMQGPWTDIYAMSATIYKCITGVTPEESMQRVIEDGMKPPSEHGIAIPQNMEKALMKGLAVFQKDRYQNLGEFCADLYGDFEDIQETSGKPGKKPAEAFAADNEKKVSGKSADSSRKNDLAGQTDLPEGIPPFLAKLGIKTKKQAGIAGGAAAAVLLILIIVFAMSGGSGGSSQSADGFPDVPTERQMATDLKNNSSINGKILDVTVTDDDINHTEETYEAECKVESQAVGGTGTTGEYSISYKLENGEWVFVTCEKLE